MFEKSSHMSSRKRWTVQASSLTVLETKELNPPTQLNLVVNESSHGRLQQALCHCSQLELGALVTLNLTKS